jgi:phospholipase C
MLRLSCSLLVLCVAVLWIVMNGCGGGASTGGSDTAAGKIKHVVIIFQENRTPDNLFQDPVLISRGADIQNYGIDSTGAHVPLIPEPLATNWDNNHLHSSFLTMYDGGKMDGAGNIPLYCDNPNDCVPPPGRPFNYVQASDVQPYYMLAETYAFGDRMFQTNQGSSFPAHQFILSGTSAPAPSGQPKGNLFVADNAAGPPSENTGCLGVPGQTVRLIDPANMDPSTNETQKVFPCFDHPTLTDVLDNKGIGWRYYAASPGILWNAPNAIQHICVPSPPIPNATSCSGSTYQKNVIINPAQVLTDIQNIQLASVVWITPNVHQSDHAGDPTGNEGPSWVASIVNAIGSSPYWSDTAIIVTWDDWGGWYDHVAPPIINSYEYGFRVPLIVISPYAKSAYISHQVNDFGSILKFIEEVFNLPNVAPGATPAYADAVNTTSDLSDFFDFSQTPVNYKPVQAKENASYFIHDHRPLQDPDPD